MTGSYVAAKRVRFEAVSVSCVKARLGLFWSLTISGVEASTGGTGKQYVVDPKIGGGLFALDLGTGEKRWASMPAT